MSANADEVDAGVPEVKVPAAVDAGGMLRFELSEEQVEQIHEQLEEGYSDADEEGFVPVRFVMDRAAYSSMSEGLNELQGGLPRVGVKQIPLVPDPEFALTVVMNAEQMSNAITTTEEALASSGQEDKYSQEFRLSEKGALLVIRQLEEALDGASDPVDAIDVGEIRRNYS
jgi:hypothetical protein